MKPDPLEIPWDDRFRNYACYPNVPMLLSVHYHIGLDIPLRY